MGKLEYENDGLRKESETWHVGICYFCCFTISYEASLQIVLHEHQTNNISTEPYRNGKESSSILRTGEIHVRIFGLLQKQKYQLPSASAQVINALNSNWGHQFDLLES